MRIVFRNPVRSFGHRARPNESDDPTEFISPLAAGEPTSVEAAATHYPVSPEEAAVLQAHIAELQAKLKTKLSYRAQNYTERALVDAKELLAGTAQWGIALRWLRNRAKEAKGDLDLDALRYGLYFLGWQLQLTTEVVKRIYNKQSDKNQLPSELSGWVRYAYTEELPEGVHLYKGTKAKQKDLPPGNYVTKWKRLGEFVETPDGVDAEGSSEIAPQWLPMELVWQHHRHRTDQEKAEAQAAARAYVGKPVIDFGESFTVVEERNTLATVTNRSGESVTFPVTGASGWKALYGLGLQEAAAAALPSLEQAAENVRKARETWGKSICAVCFGYAAVTPRKGTMVDHGHLRPGVGFNVAPCNGRDFPPYAVSDAGTRWVLDWLKHEYEIRVRSVESLMADPKGHQFTIQRPADAARPYGAQVKVAIRYGDPEYEQEYYRAIKLHINAMREIQRNIGFYAAAVRLWTPNNTIKVEDIHKAVREADKPHHPLLLARVNPRRAQRNPRRPRSRR